MSVAVANPYPYRQTIGMFVEYSIQIYERS